MICNDCKVTPRPNPDSTSIRDESVVYEIDYCLLHGGVEWGADICDAAHRVVSVWQAIQDQPLKTLEYYIRQCLVDTTYINPIPMVLHCPRCGTQHIDEPDPRVEELQVLRKEHDNSSLGDRPQSISVTKLGRLIHLEGEEHTFWSNPPHKSHLCRLCGTIWRPADIPTVGVASINSRGEKDT